jgi:Domain of unknown function (DUF397)
MKTQFDDEDFNKASLCRTCAHCVAVAHKGDVIALRDTKDRKKLTLQFNREEWQTFIAGVKRGEFDF